MIQSFCCPPCNSERAVFYFSPSLVQPSLRLEISPLSDPSESTCPPRNQTYQTRRFFSAPSYSSSVRIPSLITARAITGALAPFFFKVRPHFVVAGRFLCLKMWKTTHDKLVSTASSMMGSEIESGFGNQGWPTSFLIWPQRGRHTSLSVCL